MYVYGKSYTFTNIFSTTNVCQNRTITRLSLNEMVGIDLYIQMRWLFYLLILLILFYLFLWWSIRKAPVMKDDEQDVRRISRLLERLNEKWSRNKK